MEVSVNTLLDRTRRLTAPHLSYLGRGGEVLYISRALFGLTVALVLWLEEPDQRGSLHTWLPLAFAALSIALWALAPSPDDRIAVALHASDLLFALAVLVLGETSVLLFFMWSTYCLLSASSLWHWRAVVATGLLLSAIFILCLALGEVGAERLLIRLTYLTGATTLIAIGTRRRDQSRRKLLKIAAWASRRFEETQDALRNVLDHACDILEAGQIVVFWKEAGDGLWRRAHFYREGRGLSVVSSTFVGDGVLPEPLRGRSFIWCSTHLWLTRRGRLRLDGAAAAEALDFGPHGGRICSVPLKGQICEGRLFALELVHARAEFLTFGDLVAAHVLRRLEGNAVRRQRLSAAIEQERAKWSRDLHDGLLQSMTAMRLQLNAALSQPQLGNLQREATRTSDLLREEQERLRSIVEGSRQTSGNKSVPLRRLAELIHEVAGHWDLTAEIEAEPLHAVIPHKIFHELSFLVSEAVANAARHGPATSIKANLVMKQRMLHATFSNATSREVPVLTQSAPRSMSERILDLGGTLTFEVENNQVTLAIQVPVHD